MPTTPAAVKLDGFTSVTDIEKQTTTVWFSGTSVTKGNCLIIDTGATLPTGIDRAWKVCTTANTGLGAVIAAETISSGPATGSALKVYTNGHLTGATHGIIADSGAIALGALVSTSATSGALGTATGTYGAAVGESVIGVCVKAFTASTADGEILLRQSHWV